MILRSNVPRVIQFLSYELNVFRNKNEFSHLCLTLSDYLCEKRLNLAGSFQKIKRKNTHKAKQHSLDFKLQHVR